MGASLSTIPQWSSSPQSQTLNTSMINYDLLNEFIKVLDKICLENPQEAKTEFKRHLEWNTQSLKPSMFENNNLWNVTTSQKTGTKFVVSSSSQKSDGKPIFQLIQIMKADSVKDVSASTTTSYTAKVGSLEYLNKILGLCGEHKLMELQEIIQANQDPFSIILGIPSSTFNSSSVDPLVIAFDALNVEVDPKKRDQNQKLYKLLLVLNSFDIQLMKATVKSLEKGKAIDCDKIAEEIEMLQAFCGKEAKCALKNIDWESDYTYTNGQRSPPWRQVFGEICYVDIRPMDKDNIVVTCTRNGIYINKGYWTDEKGNEHLNYNALEGATVFTSLTELMKSYSPHFNATIDKQEYLYHPDENKIINHGAAAAEGNGHSIDNDGNSSEEVQEEETGGKRNAPDGKRTVIKKKSKTVKKNKRAIEPSLKWRALGIKSNETEKPSSKSKIYHKDNGKSDDILNKSKIPKNQNNDDLDDSESEYSSEEELQEKRPESELPAEYYQIQKLVKYLRCGNQTATIIAICSLRDFDLKNEFNQCAIKDVGGLDTLVNLLDTNDIKCKIGALQILKEISENVSIRSAICDLDGIRPLVELLKDMDDELKCLAAETISHCAKNSKSRRLVRKYGGIKKLVNLLNITFESKGDERVAISGALALATCSKSAKNKEAIQSAGALPLLSNLLQSKNEKLLIPVVEILQECASDEYYRVAIRSSGMIKFLVENLASDNQELQTHCSSAIFKCAQDDDTRDLVRQHEGLTPLVNLLDNVGNKELLVAATGAVWKCAQNIENVAAFNKLNTIKKLVGLMENQPEDVLVNVVGALGACAKTADGRQGIRESNGITPLVNLLTGTNQNLLVNVTTAVGESALDTDCMAIIDRLDGVRLLWSLLKSANPQVQASAAWAISPCIEHAKDAGEMVRSFVGGLELIVSLLKSDNTEVLASVCAAIANIARDEENLAVITDHGVVPMLAKLTNTRNDNLRRHLAEAIARCCHWGNNRVAFGTANAVSPLVKYLKSPDLEVHRSTARALHQLSMDPDNCITMHEHGVVQLLLGMVGSTNSDLQEAAAGTIGNIRRLALASEKAALTTN